MKKFIFSFLMGRILALPGFSDGVVIVDTETQTYLTLTASSVETQVNNQVAITRTSQTFRNETGQDVLAAKYAFPCRTAPVPSGCAGWSIASGMKPLSLRNPRTRLLPEEGAGPARP
ncbi:MAG: hypothetical protein IPJ40_08465 [Saprospirales bacterium]|nr:hypothetical protein [Saprospirales bacterium]